MSHFKPLLKRAYFFEAAGAAVEIGPTNETKIDHVQLVGDFTDTLCSTKAACWRKENCKKRET